jgi:5-formyltetrahydrofolate cyclo-ligase
MHDSNQLRSDVLARRDALSDQERHSRSDRIAAALLASEALERSTTVFIYVSFRSEVETLPIITELLNRNKIVTVPLTITTEKRLEIVRIEDPGSDLVPGYCSIPEPRREMAEASSVRADKLDLVVLPGSVFDERGGRFGYGGGYYDRLLAQIPKAARYGLAFELQVRERLELQPHDQILDAVITEKRVIRPAVPRLPASA